jgi:hypothetical protein
MKRNGVEEPKLPAFNYHLDESDAHFIVLRCQDEVFVATFGAAGATKGGIIQAATEDYPALQRISKP